MNTNIKQLENILKNMIYAEILNYPRVIKQSTNDVWGKYVIRTYQDNNGAYHEDRAELENWYCTFTFTEDTTLFNIIEECKKVCQEKDNQNFTSVEEAENYTCYQLCDWIWLENEAGQIIRKIVTSDGVKYEATLVKYAKILKDLECVEDKNV